MVEGTGWCESVEHGGGVGAVGVGGGIGVCTEAMG